MRRLIGIVAAAFAAVLVAPAAASAQTVVSLTFDDGIASQFSTRFMLASHGMRGTFYVNTNTLGTTDRMTWNQLATMNADGNEIAGHTLDHANLTTIDATEARRQVCDDRATLLNRGFVATSFAYPWGEYNGTAQTIVQDCGYSSARAASGLRRIVNNPYPWRSYSSPIPPPDPYAILIPCCVDSTLTLDDFKNYIMQAESSGGGWVVLLFHAICDGCAGNAVSPAIFSGLLEWLQPRAASGTVVKTVTQVISGDSALPTSTASCNGTACSAGWYDGTVSVTLSSTDLGTGVSTMRYTLDGSEPTVSSATYTGPFPVSAPGLTTVKFRAWDRAGNVEPTRSQVVRIDTQAPVSAIACNGSACASSAYGAPVSVGLSAADAGGSGVAVIRYTTDGSTPTTASAAYTGPFTVSETATVMFRAWDNAGNAEAVNSQLIQIATAPPTDTQPPSSAVTCNGSACSPGWYGASVAVALSAADDQSGVAALRYTLDGSDPTPSSPLYTGPFTLSATTTVNFRAWDNAGNVEPTRSQTIRIDTQAPNVAITSPASGSSAKGNVKISADASDALSGVVSVSFYVNGVLIGTKTSTPYFVNWQTNKLKGSFTLTAIATDAAGNNRISSPVVVTVN